MRAGPCFHDDYLPAFNLPGVELVDTDGKGIQRITPKGIVVRTWPEACSVADLVHLSRGYARPSCAALPVVFRSDHPSTRSTCINQFY